MSGIMENMKKVAQLLKNLRETSSTNDKQRILQDGFNSEYNLTLRKVLVYGLDPFKMYGLTEQTLDKVSPENVTFTKPTEEEVFHVLGILADSNINNELRSMAKALLMAIEDEEVQDMVLGIMVKDLNIGVGATTINKLAKGLISKFDVQLAESFSKQKDGALNGKKVWITEKLDGFRCVYNPVKNEFRTRQGQPYDGLDHLKESCMLLCERLQEAGKLKTLPILDGELLHKPVEGLNSQELYTLTTKAARKKGEHKDKLNLEFNVFDFIPVDEFQAGLTVLPYNTRRDHMDKVFALWNFKGIVPVKALYSGVFDEQILMNLLKEVESKGQEGLMINLDKPYECKRSKGLLKVKTFKVCDALVLEVQEGEGNFKGTLGGVKIQYLYNGEAQTCFCGSGFTQEEREMYWSNPNEIVGKVVEIQYFETTTNSKTGEHGLRFPTFQHRIRTDKGTEDITDVAITD